MQVTTSTNIFFERDHEPLVPVKECIRACAAAGYRGLDFGFPELALISDRFRAGDWLEELREYKELADSLGIRFVQAHAAIWDFCQEDTARQEKRQLFERSIRGAAFLGADWIVVHPSSGAEDTHERNVAFFRQYSDFAGEYGIGLAVENMWGKTRSGVPRYAVNPEELFRLLEDIGRENVKVCWDVEHGSIEGIDQRKALQLLKDYIVATHISDEAGPENIHILPYLGKADWEEILEALAQIQYDGNLNFEIQHYLPGVPGKLVPAAMRFSYEVGTYMADRLEKKKQEKKYVSVSI